MLSSPPEQTSPCPESVVPTGYLVMDFMTGDDWRYLTHPQHPATAADDRVAIARQLGEATAQIHTIARPCGQAPGAGVIHGLDALERVVSGSDCLATSERIGVCRQIAASDPALVLDEETWGVGDAGIHFAKSDHGWQVAFLCDLEYQGYTDPYHDMAPILCHPNPIWHLTEPLSDTPASSLSNPYFEGYEQVRPIDRGRLAAIAVYSHLGTMCGVTREAYRADDGVGIESREPLIYLKLLQAIERRGASLGII